MPGSRADRPVQITIAGSHDAPEEVCAAAERVGAVLAALGVTIVTGGRGGVMEHAARGARDAGGRVIAVLPGTALDDLAGPADAVIPTGMGHGRNLINVLAGDALVPLAGGAGTMSEICFALIHDRPVFVIEGLGGASDEALREPPDPRKRELLVACADADELQRVVRDRLPVT